ncbi:unnamed protein product [Blepharisma stoltei]|uniref:COMM domain-containing protein n=1 Tax=Blepharisma stoltei TaxID=1481888 RepID=A0AAU9K1E2_9CILI|nr:unnamed protein product [Blepharisma stoltei]
METYSLQDLVKGVHDSVDYLCNYPVDFITGYNNSGLSLFYQLKPLLRSLMSDSPDASQIENKLQSEYRLNQEQARGVTEAFLLRRADIQSYMVSNVLSSCKVDNFDWNISLVMSTSNKANLGIPLLQLELSTKDENNDEQKCVLEFTFTELNDFISKLQQIQQVCLSYSSN